MSLVEKMSASVTLPLCSCSSVPVSARTRAPSILLMKAEMGIIRSSRRTKAFSCNAFFGLGVPELVVIAGVSAVVFGPKNLPQLGRSIGKTLKSFQQVRWFLWKGIGHRYTNSYLIVLFFLLSIIHFLGSIWKIS